MKKVLTLTLLAALLLGACEKEENQTASVFCRPLSDVPCRKAPQVAYIVMFVTRWHRKSGGKDTFFPFRMADPKRACKVWHAPRRGGKYV